jgi:hypothetical protein
MAAAFAAAGAAAVASQGARKGRQAEPTRSLQRAYTCMLLSEMLPKR